VQDPATSKHPVTTLKKAYLKLRYLVGYLQRYNSLCKSMNFLLRCGTCFSCIFMLMVNASVWTAVFKVIRTTSAGGQGLQICWTWFEERFSHDQYCCATGPGNISELIILHMILVCNDFMLLFFLPVHLIFDSRGFKAEIFLVVLWYNTNNF
jgi:hypothetical protein